jgi:hypothetical protein
MIRTDGKFKFYKIQHQQVSDRRWVGSIYGEPKVNSKTDMFTASGRCWQLLGEHGVFDIRNARVGLRNARKNVLRDVKNGRHGKPLKLRLVLVEIEQKRTPIE